MIWCFSFKNECSVVMCILQVSNGEEGVVKVEARKNWNGMYVYRATCLRVGEVAVTLSVGNKPSADLPKPVEASSTVKVVCAHPDRVKLATGHQDKDCPLAGKTGRLAGLAYQDLHVFANVFDSQVGCPLRIPGFKDCFTLLCFTLTTFVNSTTTLYCWY